MDFMPLESDRRISFERQAEDTARIVASLLPESIVTIERAFDRPFAKPVSVKVFESDDSFATSTGATKREWGVMISGTVFLSGMVRTAPKDHLGALLRHELVHLYLEQRRGASGIHPRLPMWFEEGLAELVSGGSAMELVTEAEAARAILAGKHLFSDTADTNLAPDRCKYGVESHMFYRQAEMFVASLQSRDATMFRSFMLALADGHDFESSWRTHFGYPVRDAWRQFQGELESHANDPRRGAK